MLAAVSACPSDGGRCSRGVTSASNGGEPKRIGLEVWVDGSYDSAAGKSSGTPPGEGK